MKLLTAIFFFNLSTVALANERLFILAVGINSYSQDAWNDLKYAASDAEKFVEALKSESPYQVEATVLNDTEATKQNVLAFFKRVRRKARRSDTVIVYFSGHGSLFRSKDGAWQRVFVLHNTEKDSLSKTGLTHKYLRKQFRRLKVKKKAGIFASCHSGIGKSYIPPAIANLLAQTKSEGVDLPIEKASEGTIFLSASSRMETARESSKLSGDIYTSFLIEGLSIYDRNQDGAVSIREAHDFAKRRTFEFTKGKQRPTMVVEEIGDGDFPLRGKVGSAKEAVLQAYEPEFDGMMLEVDGQKGPLPMAFSVKSGQKVKLYSDQGEFQRTFRVRAAAGEVINLSELALPQPLTLGVQVFRGEFAGPKMKGLGGDNLNKGSRISLNYNYRWIVAGVFYDFSRGVEKEIESSIRSETILQTAGLQIGIRHFFNSNWLISGLLQMEQVRMGIDIQDTAARSQISRSDKKLRPALELAAGYRTNHLPLYWQLSYSQTQKTEFDFSELGSIEQDESRVSFGVQIEFGGKGGLL